jgi:hypothetical protein
MTRRTKVVSHSIEMIELSIKLWVHVNKPHEFAKYQQVFRASIYA